VAAPVLGYVPRSRGLIRSAMWVMLGRLAVGAVRMTVASVEVLEGSTSGKSNVTPGYAGFAVLEAVLFLLSLLLFVAGLTSLRREEPHLPEIDRSRFGDRDQEWNRERGR
jgi:hypothetical protein